MNTQTTDNKRPSTRLLVRIEEAAEILSLSRSTVYDMIYKGEITSIKRGSIRRIPVEALEKWVAEHTIQGEA